MEWEWGDRHDDASYATISSKQAGTYRSNFGLIETAGKAATVRVTVTYRANANKTSSLATASATYTLAPNQMLLGSIANVLGANRNAIGDLHNATVDFQVTSNTGTVFPFITSVDNASGDSIIRFP